MNKRPLSLNLATELAKRARREEWMKDIEKQGRLNSLWQWLSNVGEYRIPVYQELVGVAGGLLMFVSVKYFPNSARSGW